jgi:hypothetical protein
MLNDPDRLPPGRDSKLLSRQLDAGLGTRLDVSPLDGWPLDEGRPVSPSRASDMSPSDTVKEVTQTGETKETIPSPHAVFKATATPNVRAGLGPRILVVMGFIWLVVPIASWVYISGIFGMVVATVLSVLLALPLVVLARMVWRMVWRGPAVRAREYVFLAILVACVLSLWVFLVQGAFANGAHHRYAEDVRWSTFERRCSQDPAFRFIQVHELTPKNIHWASGTVATEADLARLKALAAECGIELRIDRPNARSVSITIAPGG